jgi:hypothetical protein
MTALSSPTIIIIIIIIRSRGSAVVIATGYELDGPGLEYR